VADSRPHPGTGEAVERPTVAVAVAVVATVAPVEAAKVSVEARVVPAGSAVGVSTVSILHPLAVEPTVEAACAHPDRHYRQSY